LVVNATPRALYPRKVGSVPILQDGGLAPGPVWMDAENRVFTGFRSPDRLSRSFSIYPLRYPRHLTKDASAKLLTYAQCSTCLMTSATETSLLMYQHWNILNKTGNVRVT
jgi:hypothetical protein